MTGHTLITYTSNVLEFLWMCLGLTVAYKKRYSTVRTLLTWFGCAALFLAALLIWDSFHPTLYFYWIDFILCGLLYATSLKGQFSLKGTMVVVYCAAFFIVVHFLSRIPYPAVFSDQMDNYRTFSLIGKGLLACYFAQSSLKSRQKLPVFYWLPVMLISLLMLGTTYYQMTAGRTEGGETVISVYYFCLLSVLCVLTGVYSGLIRRYEESMIRIAISSDVVDNTALLQENSRLSKTISEMEHEWKNHLASLSALLSSGHTEDARQMIQSLNLERSVHSSAETRCGNNLADALLKRYEGICREKNILFTDEAVIGNDLSVTPQDLSSVLSNLLNNAVEGSENIQNPEIIIRIFPMKDYLCIQVRNRANMEGIRANPSLFTTKKEPAFHGIGLGVVNSIAKKYNGWMQIKTNDAEWFSVEVALLVN